MKYLLDTCVISDFVKGESHTTNRLKSTIPTNIAVSTITVMELLYGLELNPKHTAVIRPIIMDLLNTVIVLEFSQEDAEKAARVRTHLKQQGCPIGSYDVLLAGSALSRQLI